MSVGGFDPNPPKNVAKRGECVQILLIRSEM